MIMTNLPSLSEWWMDNKMLTKKRVVDLRSLLPRHPTRKWKKRKKISWLIVHMTASNNQDPYKTNEYHISPGNHISKKGCPRITYHDYITDDGTIYHCNNYFDWIWHCGWINRWSAGITMAFRGQTKDNSGNYITPPAAQWRSLIQHLVRLCLYLNLSPNRIKGHREVRGFWKLLGRGSKKYKTSCPGFGIDLDELRTQVCKRLQIKLASENLYKGKIDGKFFILSKAALKLYHQNLLVALTRK